MSISKNLRRRLKKATHAIGTAESARSLVDRGRAIRKLLQASPYPLHRNEPIEPFFVVGSGRCGTTLLRRILTANPTIHIPPENWKLGASIYSYREYRGLLNWEDLVRLTISCYAWQAKHAGDDYHLFFDSQSPAPLFHRLRRTSEEKRSLAHIIDEVYCEHGKMHDVQFERWGDKTPLNAFYMQAIADVFPRAKFVHLLRDGADVVPSFIKMGRYDNIEEPALRWKSAVEQARRFMKFHPDQCIEIRYESLVEQPAETVERLCNFLSIKYMPAMINELGNGKRMKGVTRLSHHTNVFTPISSAYIGKGRRNLSQSQREVLDVLIGAEMERLGYPPLR